MKAMILAAGLGTRLKPFTDKHPKALAEINGKPLLQRNIEYLLSFGIRDIVINVHHFADQIESAVNRNQGWGANIQISDERNEVLETGGGLLHAAHFFQDNEEPFLLMNADVLTDLDVNAMLTKHKESEVLATLAVSNRETSRYLLFDSAENLCGWKNEKTGELKGKPGAPKAFSGVHIISPRVFAVITETGKFSLIDLYLRLADSEILKAFDHSGSKFIDVGKPESLVKAAEMFP